ncbi:HTH CenpB-type DNA-binding domain [Trinorchestia longiramus]|nr:HTH CenpB-type DNA-binding domain [Trinorchestia longiramus]
MWLKRAREQNLHVGGDLIKEKAMKLAGLMHIPDFMTSDGWLDNFKKHHGITFKTMQVETGAVSASYGKTAGSNSAVNTRCFSLLLRAVSSNISVRLTGVNISSSFDRADAGTNVQSKSGKEKGEKGRVFKLNLGFNVTKTLQSEDNKVILVCPIGVEAHTFTTEPGALVQGIGSTVFAFNAPPCCHYHCQRLRHVAVNCNLPLCCLVCSGPHTKNECTTKPRQEKCTNCYQMNHTFLFIGDSNAHSPLE